MDTENINVVSLTKDNKAEFLLLLEDALRFKFESIPENYGREKPWSLISLILNDEIDTYQLLYVNGKIWAGSGGIIRQFNDEKVYQAGFRGFSTTTKHQPGLGSKFYIHKYNTLIQIERAKVNNCKKVILSFNDYNYQLFKLTGSVILPQSGLQNLFEPSVEPILFNGVQQWLLTYDIN
jgi:hypothetical protein